MDEFMKWPWPGEKPEFGNQKHIDAIKARIREVEDEESLRDYEVEIEVTGTVLMKVRAHDVEEARAMAEDASVDFEKMDEPDRRIVSITDVTKDKSTCA